VSLYYGTVLHSDEESVALHLKSSASLLSSSIASVFYSMVFIRIFPPNELISSLPIPPDLTLK
jgi:hypothetical protein